MELLVTFCDRCNPDCDPNMVMTLSLEASKALGLEPYADVSRGVAWVPERIAVDNSGWKETDQGTLCPVCVAEVAEEMVTEIGLPALTEAIAAALTDPDGDPSP